MATEVTLPELGESVTEGTVTAWLVDVGDQVETDQPLFELSSDKIDTEVPSPASGVLKEIKVGVDETVDVGTVVAVIGAADEEAGDGGTQAPSEPEASAEAPAEAEETEAGADEQETDEQETEEQVAEDTGADQDAEAQASGEPADAKAEADPDRGAGEEEPQQPEGQAAAGADGQEDGQGDGQVMSPIVRRMVAEHNLDPSQIQGSGQGGRITREDVEAMISQGEEQPAQAQQTEQPAQAQEQEPEAPREDATPKEEPQPERQTEMESGERERVEPLSRIRQRIAARMMESMQSSAQLTTVQEADVTAVMKLRARYKDQFRQREGISLSPFAIMCRAALLALPRHEKINAQADWDAGQVKFHDYVNLGIAVDTEKGLIVPNIKNAADLSLAGLARAIAEGANKARGKGQLEMHDIQGGTFTMTNIGSVGVLQDTPILNYPEPAILGTGAVKKRPVVIEDPDGYESIAIRAMSYLCLTYDHRLIDGADAARFVGDVKQVLEQHDWAAELGYDVE